MKKDTARINSLKELIKSKKLDALCFFHPEDVLMSAGMLPAAPFTVSIVNRGGRITVICPWWIKEQVELHSWADSVYGFNWLKNLKGVDPSTAILGQVSKLAKRFGIKNIGVDNDLGCLMPSYTPSSCFTYSSLKTALGSIFRRIVDITAEVHRLRAVKTDYEIKRIRKANFVAREATKAFYKQARAGSREVDVAAEILRAVQWQVGKNGIKYTYCDPPQISSGPKRTLIANALTCPATNKRLRTGELAMLELGGCADGYWFDLTRTLVVGGSPKQAHKDMAWAIRAASQAAYNCYKNGENAASVITRIALDVLKNLGFKKGILHGLGHGVGFAYHEALPGIGPDSDDIILPGMITSMEPGLYLPGIGGMRIEDNVLWEKESVTILSDFHSDLGSRQR